MKRIKYVSQFSMSLSDAEIDQLIDRAAAKNERLDITGIIMSSGRVFFQVIEGPSANIDELFSAIAGDPRHRDVLLLESENGISERFFPDWSLRKIGFDAYSDERMKPVRDLLVTVLEKRQELARLTLALEKALWHELAAAAD